MLSAVGVVPELMPQIGMRVQMAKGYTEQGVGTVVSIPGEGVCSVKWDSGLTEVRCCSAPDRPLRPMGDTEKWACLHACVLRAHASAAVHRDDGARAHCDQLQACIFTGKHGLYQLLPGTLRISALISLLNPACTHTCRVVVD
jgi:hypothetical protein